ncbi:hypothetical protein [Mesorhizobium kowhaii]|uniref:Uncharacterized protein n=1 Tax=Mesorhizobium kowhaii TaxID=1300272 RepID=A0A2W7BTW7_9HYPH|nr:hypothetical protein [Mesorhizobium kowhaii]PZV34017.1 hypothetical protein B5V02_33465 [Mesorhizobium kowhaii]
MTIDQTTANVMTALLRELSSELDLHHNDEELHTLEPTIKTLRRAAKVMADAGYKAPEVYHHIVGRFDRMTRA